jgi:predicted phage-related endonuclease
MIVIQVREDVSRIVELKRIPLEVVKALLTCEVHDLPFVQESKLITTDVNSALSQLLSLEEIILSHKEEVARVEKESAILKEFLIEEMKKSDVKKWETDKIIATYVASTKRIGVDSKKLKDDYPEIFAEVAKESEVKESLRIKIN